MISFRIFNSEGEEDDNKKRKNISLPKITKTYLYNNPYNPDDQNVNHLDKEEKNEFQQFKSSLEKNVFFLKSFKIDNFF